MTAPQPSGDSFRKLPADERSTPSSPENRDLLERIVQETLANEAQVEPLDPAEWVALRSVGRRYAGQPLALEPMAVECIDALLRIRFQRLQQPDEFWRHVARRIAEALWDAPDSRARLEALWTHLCEAS
jgi:hypothetical protein